MSNYNLLLIQIHLPVCLADNLYLPLVKSRRYKSVCFFFIHLSNVSGCYLFIAFRTVNCTMIFREVYRAVDYPVIEHFYKPAFTDLLIISDETFTVCTAHF